MGAATAAASFSNLMLFNQPFRGRSSTKAQCSVNPRSRAGEGAIGWSVDSWKSKKKVNDQLPVYPDPEALDAVCVSVASSHKLVICPNKTQKLEESLSHAAAGQAFLVHAGYRETFGDINFKDIAHRFWTLLQFSDAVASRAQLSTIIVSQMAGSFPKSAPDLYEERSGVKLPSYRGDIINNEAFDEKARTPDPHRMTTALEQSYDIYRVLGSYASSFFPTFPPPKGPDHFPLRYSDPDYIVSKPFWISHECLLLPYEQALTSKDTKSGLYYDNSAHMLWLGELTQQRDGAHVEFLRGVSNPIGIQVGDKTNPDQLVKLIDVLNPENRPGRIALVCKMRGIENTRVVLPHLIRAVQHAKQIVTWVNDPVHGDSMVAPLDAIVDEMEAFFCVHYQEGSYPGGIHLNIMSKDPLKRTDGASNEDYLSSHTQCDSGLSASQYLELTSNIAEWTFEERLKRLKSYFMK